MRLKLLALASLSAVAISFTACGGDSNKTEEKAPAKTEAPAPAQHETKATPAKTEAPAPAQTTASAAPVDGAQIFQKCAGCHGAHGERSALGKSQVIAGWEASKVENALHGYKDGTYGGAMKGIMKGQASTLTDEQIKAVAKYISTL